MIEIAGSIKIPKYLIKQNRHLSNAVNHAKVPNPKAPQLKAMKKWCATHINCFKQDADNVYLMRGYLPLIQRICVDHQIKIVDHRVTKHKTYKINQFTPYAYQQDAIDKVVAQESGVLISPAGSGKTKMIFKIMAAKSQKTLIVVPLQVIGDQISAELTEYGISNQFVKSGVIYDSKLDATVVTIHSINKVNLNLYGMIIVDETHRVSSSMYTDGLYDVPAKYRYGLTATLERKDKMDFLVTASLGKVIHEVPMSVVKVIRPTYIQIPTPWKFLDLNNDFTELMTFCTESQLRNDFLIKELKAKIIKKEKTLVVTHRVEHAKLIGAALGTKYILYGTLSKKKRDKVISDFRKAKSGVLVSVISLVEEGFDVPDLTTLFMLTPFNNYKMFVQVTGRVERYDYNNAYKNPKVWDFTDPLVALLNKHAKARAKFYIRKWLNSGK
jgi:superfamily II DNA or RNA helicase